ncbi:MAG: methylmalonyl-CoA mutase family protein [Candidatus Delongbacteria bacterium]
MESTHAGLPQGEFAPVTRPVWERCAQESLKGRPLASLRGESEDGLSLEPLYWLEDLERLPHVQLTDPAGPESARPGAWEIRQECLSTTPAELRAELQELDARGQASLPLSLERLEAANGPLEPARLAELLEGWEPGGAILQLACGAEPARGAGLLAALPTSVTRRLLCDWTTAGLRQGRHPAAAAGELAALWQDPAAPAATLRISGVAAHEAGATSAQELALWLSAWTAAARELEAVGVPLETLLEKSEHELSSSRDLFESLARLRAARLLAARWLEAAGVPPEGRGIRLGARGSLRHQTRRDPWVNLLRVALAGFAAAAGGADFLHLPTLAEGLGASDAQARRLAANAQVILQDEAHLARVADPARGSAYVESLTAALAERAWTLFQELEAAGGYWAALAEGLPQAWLREAGERRQARLARRRETLVGTSAYPNLGETLPDWGQPGAPVPPPPAADFAIPPRRRLAEELEALREQGARLAGQGLPPVWLATFGPLKQHKARADFSRGFLAVAGLPCGQDEGHADPLAAAAAAAQSGAAVVVCCSSDESYPELVPVFVPALREAERAAGRAPALLLLAGHPPEQLDALRAAGVQGFLHLKASLPEVLIPVLQRLEEHA